MRGKPNSVRTASNEQCAHGPIIRQTDTDALLGFADKGILVLDHEHNNNIRIAYGTVDLQQHPDGSARELYDRSLLSASRPPLFATLERLFPATQQSNQ